MSAMFKFKMLTKVLVAVFFYGTIIELNLNLCIALSIDLDAPASGAKLSTPWSPSEAQGHTQAPRSEVQEDTDADRFADELSLASRAPTSQTEPTEVGTQLPSLESTTTEPFNRTATTTTTTSVQLLKQTLESNGRLYYFGIVRVGSEQTPFVVLFHLSSSAFWLASSECKSSACISRQKYNGSSSSTFELLGGQSIELAYGSASSSKTDDDDKARVQVRLVRDQVTFANVSLEAQTFGEALEMSGESFQYLPVDGFFGLGARQFRTDEQSNAAAAAAAAPETPLEQLYRRGLMREPMFSLLIKATVEEYKYSADSGELYLGQLAPGYQASDLTYVPVTHVDFWEFHLEGVSLRHSNAHLEVERACESACPAILDTGTQQIAGHFTDVDRLNKALGAYPVGDGLYRLSQCDLGLLPDLVFTIGGVEFSLAPDEYVSVQQVRGNVLACYSVLRVVQADTYPFWILGEQFLKRHYVVFDYGQRRLGFAKSKTIIKETEVDILGRLRRMKKHHIV